MDTVIILLEALVVVGCIIMGTRSSGVALGLWGGLGVAVLAFGFGNAPGAPPVDAILIVLSVVLAASMMQAAGGIDWMVKIAADLIRKRPKWIVVVAPLTSWLFSVGAGTANILYPLLPVIYDTSYSNNVRPERAMSMSVVATGLGVVCSPVSAAMAALITLTDVSPHDFNLVQVLGILIPAGLFGVVVGGVFSMRRGAELDVDPEVQRRIAAGEIPAPDRAAASASQLESTAAGRNSAMVFLLGVLLVVLLGLFPDLRPSLDSGDGPSPIGMSAVIQMVMFSVGTVILLVGRPAVSEIPTMPVFRAGMVSAIALFGLAWLTDTFIKANEDDIISTIGSWVQSASIVTAFAFLLLGVLTTSQSTAIRTVTPIALTAGLAPATVVAMVPAAGGIYVLPTNGTQIAAANFDLSGTTSLGTRVLDNSFVIPQLVTAAAAVAMGLAVSTVFF